MRQRLGQHFLIDPGVRDAIAAAARLSPGESVVEIGPGRGFLTQALLDRGARVYAVELDDRLAPELPGRLTGAQGLIVRHADFLTLDLDELGPGPVKFVANLPYAVAAPILQRILPWPRWTSAVLMFQKEVALRLTARPGGGDYGLLTLSTLLYAKPEFLIEVPRDRFSPRPQVSSAVVRLTRREGPLVEAGRQPAFFRVAKAAFGQRRKMAAGPIAAALGLPRERVAEALRGCGVRDTARPEEIPLEAYERLAAELCAP